MLATSAEAAELEHTVNGYNIGGISSKTTRRSWWLNGMDGWIDGWIDGCFGEWCGVAWVE